MSIPEIPEMPLLKVAYAAFNARDIGGALARMQKDVAWPNGMEGGYVYGHAEVRAYWTRQWRVVDSHVEPVAFEQDDSGRVLVRVHQLIKDLTGAVLIDQYVGHLYTFKDGLVQTMEIVTVSP